MNAAEIRAWNKDNEQARDAYECVKYAAAIPAKQPGKWYVGPKAIRAQMWREYADKWGVRL